MSLDDIKATREEELYHESARDLAARVVELEDRVEGLETQLHDTEGDAVRLAEDNDKITRALNDLMTQNEQEQRRYKAALVMIERRQEQLNLHRKAYTVLANQYKQLAEKHQNLSVEIANLNNSVRDLHNVNTVDIDDAISALANAIDTALLR